MNEVISEVESTTEGEATSNEGTEIETSEDTTMPSSIEDVTKEVSKEAKQPQKEPNYKGTKHKIKVDKEELELDYDEMVKLAQKGRGADKRFQEAAMLKKQIEAEYQQIFKDPKKYFEKAGIDMHRFSEDFMLKQLEESLLTPEEKELKELKSFKEQREQELREQKETEEKAQREALLQQEPETIHKEILEVLDKTQLRPTARTVARIAQHMLAQIEANPNAKPSAQDSLQHVANNYVEDIKDIFTGLPVETAIEILPKEIVEGIRQYYVKQASSTRKPVIDKSAETDTNKKKSQKESGKKWDEFWRDFK